MGDITNHNLIQGKDGVKLVQHAGQINNHGTILSDHTLNITAKKLHNANSAKLVAKHNITLNIEDLENNGSIESKTDDIVINGNNIINRATITAAKDIHIDASETFQNIDDTGQIIAFNKLQINTNQFVNSGHIEAHNNAGITTQLDSTNDGIILSGKDLTLTAPSWVNNGHIQANNNLTMTATTGSIDNRETIRAGHIGTIKAQTNIINNGKIYIPQGTIEAINGKIQNNSLINSNADLTLTAKKGIYNARNAEIDVVKITFQPGSGQSIINDGDIHATSSMTARDFDKLINRKLIEAHTLNITANTIDNAADATIKGAALNSFTKKIDNKGDIRFTHAGVITVNNFNSYIMSLGQGSNLTINGNFVNNKEIHATDATFTLSAHSIDNRGKIKARHLTLKSDSHFKNSGVIFAKDYIKINAPSSFTNTGYIVGKDLRLTTSGAFTNKGGIFGQIFAINAGSFDNANDLFASGNITINASHIINRAGEISAASITLNGALTNYARIISVSDLTVNSTGKTISNSGIMTAHGNATLTSTALNNNGKIEAVYALRTNQTGSFNNTREIFGGRIEINASGGITNKHHIVSRNNLTLTSSGGDVINDGGQIAALGSGATLKIRARNLKNSRPYTINRIDPSKFNFHRMPATRQWYHSGPSGEYIWDAAYPRETTIGPTERVEYFSDPPVDVYNGVRTITTTDYKYNESVDTPTPQASISSAGTLDINVTNHIDNIAGNITAKNNIIISGQSLNNQDVVAQQYTIRKTYTHEYCEVINSRKTTGYHKYYHNGSILPPAEHSRVPSIIKAGGTISGSLSGRVAIGSNKSGARKSVSAPTASIGTVTARGSRSAPTIAPLAATNTTYTPTIPRTVSQTMSTTSESGAKFTPPALPSHVGRAAITKSRLQQIATRAANKSTPAAPIAKPIDPQITSLVDLDSEVSAAINAARTSNRTPASAGKKYIKETSPVFTEFEQYFSTQNFIKRLPNYNPDNEPIHYGDAFNQMQLIQQQIVDLSGTNTLNDDAEDPVKTMQQLYQSGERLGRDLKLAPGITLSEAHINKLQDDIVWPEIVNLGGQDVLIPRLYLAKNKNHPKTKSGIYAKNITLAASQIDNYTNISAANSLNLTATDGDIRNLGGTIRSGNSLQMIAQDNIINDHGAINAKGDSVLLSGGDIINTHATISAKGNLGLDARKIINQSKSTTKVTDARNFTTTMNGPKSSIKAGKKLVLSSREDILNRASNIEAGSLAIATGGDFTADSVTLESATYRGGGSNMSRSYSRDYATSSINVAGGVTAQIAGDFTLKGSRLNSGGKVNLLTHNLAIESQVGTNESERRWTSGRSGLFRSKKNHHSSSKHDHVLIAGISADEGLELGSSNIQRFVGAKLQAGKKLKLKTAHLQDHAIGLTNQASYSKTKSSAFWRSAKASGNATTNYTPTTIEGEELVLDITSSSLEVVDHTPTRLAKAVEAAAHDVTLSNTQTQRHSFRKHSHSLSPAAGAVVSLAGGALTAWAGGFGAGLGTVSAKAVAITALEAGATTLGGTAAVALVNNDLRLDKAAKDVTSKQAMRSALRAGATAGIGGAISDVASLGKVASDMSNAQRFSSVASHAAVQSGVGSVIHNQDLGKAAINAAASGGLAAAQFGVGEYAAAHNISDGTVTKAAMHGLVGAGFGATTGNVASDLVAGATAELAATALGTSRNSVKTAGVVGAASTLLLGGDESAVSTASSVASSAHQYNFMYPHPDPEINRKKDEGLQQASETSTRAAEAGADWVAEHPEEALQYTEAGLTLLQMHPLAATVATGAKIAISTGRAGYYLANKAGIIKSAEHLTPAQVKNFTGKTIEHNPTSTPAPAPVAAPAPKATVAPVAKPLPGPKATAVATNSNSSAASTALPAKAKPVQFQKEAGKQGGMVVKRGRNNRITGVKYTQRHHILHQKLGDHELFEKAGKHVEMPGNKMLLPTTKGTQYTTTTRSVHQGRHTKDIERELRLEMNKALRQGEQEGWSQEQYAKALREIIHKERTQLKSGARTLNAAKDHRMIGE